MAGTNLVLKPNQQLFKEGDHADGMYVVRKGELAVYLHKDGHEVRLASVGAGGMIGEMAFFDRKPRSACVKAAMDAEVTKISEADFNKLLAQIPKWFVGIMSSLSARLRDTNDRLQRIENKNAGAKAPFEDLIKILHVLILIWHKDGVKEGKSVTLERSKAEDQLVEIFGVEKKWIENFFDTLIKQKFFTVTLDNYKKQLLSTANRAMLRVLANFIRKFVKDNSGAKALPEGGIQMLEAICKLAKASAYDSAVLTLDDVIQEGDLSGMETSEWNNYVKFFQSGSEALSITKSNDALAFKANKVEMPKVLELYRLLNILSNAGLSG